jgi:integrase/recombinase XerD
MGVLYAAFLSPSRRSLAMTPLRQRMIAAMQIRNFTANTQAAYLQQIVLLARYYHQSPEALGPQQIQAYQLYLTNERKLAPGSLCTIAAALRFLYHVTLKRDWARDDIPIPKKPLKLPVILSPEEVEHFLACVGSLTYFPHIGRRVNCEFPAGRDVNADLPGRRR